MATRKKKPSAGNLAQALNTANTIGQTIITWKEVGIALGLLVGAAAIINQAQNNSNRLNVQQQNNNRLNVKNDNPSRIPVR